MITAPFCTHELMDICVWLVLLLIDCRPVHTEIRDNYVLWRDWASNLSRISRDCWMCFKIRMLGCCLLYFLRTYAIFELQSGGKSVDVGKSKLISDAICVVSGIDLTS